MISLCDVCALFHSLVSEKVPKSDTEARLNSINQDSCLFYVPTPLSHQFLKGNLERFPISSFQRESSLFGQLALAKQDIGEGEIMLLKQKSLFGELKASWMFPRPSDLRPTSRRNSSVHSSLSMTASP